MINKLYDDRFATELLTKVPEVREDNGSFWHAYKDTIFYKEGGGMASNIGMISEYVVLDLRYEEGHMWHLLDTRLEGTAFMSMNLHERFRKCQIHTVQHLISAVFNNVYKVETLTHHVGDEENDAEFSSKDFTNKMVFKLWVLHNGLIRGNLGVSIQYLTRVEASRMAKDKNLDRGDLRVVRIGALDHNMCGCMYAPSLRCLQVLYTSGCEKTARGYKIKYLVGNQLLDYVSRRHKVLDEASRSLAVSHLYVNAGVNRLIDGTRQLNRDTAVQRQKYCEMLGKELGQSEEDIVIYFFGDINVKSEADVAKYATENYKKVVISIAETYDNVHVVVASHKDMDFDPAKVFKEIVNAHHLEGGGSTQLSQGGGMYSEETIKFVKTHRFSRKIMIY